MKRGAAIACAGLLALAATACSTGPQRHARGERPLPLGANPSAVIAADLAFARAAQDLGQWSGYARFAAAEAQLYAPDPVNALQWLKGRANPAVAARWQPYRVWSSCDGSLAATHGARQGADGAAGQYLTVWQRQRDGSFKWLLDVAGPVDAPLARPEMLSATVADCPAPRAEPDTSLSWRIGAPEGGTRAVELYLMQGGQRQTVLRFDMQE